MALSDIPREKDKKRPRRAIVAETNIRWSDAQKLEAAQSWLVLGNMSLDSRVLGIPRITLQVWKTTEWWNTLIADIKLQEKIELSNKMKKIVEAAHSVVEDRLVNGDVIIHPKTGEAIRKPVNMRDAHRVAVDLQNQKEAIDKASLSTDVVEEKTDRLEQLAEKFAEFATKSIEKSLDKKRTIDVGAHNVEDVTVVQRGGDALEVLSSFGVGIQGLDEGPQEEAQEMGPGQLRAGVSG